MNRQTKQALIKQGLNTAIRWPEIEAAILSQSTQINWDFWLRCYPALERAKTTPQDPEYHAEGDVWIHTQMVVNSLVNSEAYQASREQEQVILFLAALLHDVAKADTTTIDPETGKIGHPYHSPRGAIDARIYLWFQEAPFMIREAICGLILHHQKPFYLLKQTSPEYLLHKLSWEIPIHLLLILAKADLLGRISSNQQRSLDDLMLLEALAIEENCFTAPRPFYNAVTRCEYARHKKGHPDYDFFKSLGSDVIVLSGLPASGKNSWVAKHYPNLPVISFDDTRDELGLKHGENHRLVANTTVEKAKKLLRKKTAFIWNATNIAQDLRKKTLDLLFQYDANVQIVYLEQKPNTLFTRNQQREQVVPDDALERMLKRWDIPKVWEAYQVDYLINQ